LPIATLTGEGSSGNLIAAEPLAQPASSRAPLSVPAVVLDRVDLLARVEGDRALLVELVRLFVQERPSLLGAMETALAQGDGPELARAAHMAKGAFGNLSAPLALQAAVDLELLARRGELALATDVFLRLRQEVERLEAELLALTQDDRAA
jgi:HPt (histidine-containing phosphotransfer) domain-containing protein